MTGYSFAQPKITVPGPLGDAMKERIENDRAVCGDYTLLLKHDAPFLTGQTNRFEFSIQDRAGNPVETENFLGAAMHLVIIREDLSVFLHAHPDNHSPIATNVNFRQIFPEPGKYKMFAQFRPGAAHLAEGDALLGEFFVRVR
jgi:hypothetical protein